jgi:Uma2 family endonuclease
MRAITTTDVPLESGDRLTRAEFHRRYCLRPDIRKAELVQGVVYVPSPVRWQDHSYPQSLIVMWLGNYAAITPGVEVGTDATLLLAGDTEVQPDAFLFRIDPPGTARVTERGYIEGPPELVVEIAASSAAYDLHDKMDAYRDSGVREYLIWQVYERRIDWFERHEGRYRPLPVDGDGTVTSRVFPGLRLDPAAMLAGDRARVLAALHSSDAGRPERES